LLADQMEKNGLVDIADIIDSDHFKTRFRFLVHLIPSIFSLVYSFVTKVLDFAMRYRKLLVNLNWSYQLVILNIGVISKINLKNRLT
jgi:hypothetical protein